MTKLMGLIAALAILGAACSDSDSESSPDECVEEYVEVLNENVEEIINDTDSPEVEQVLIEFRQESAECDRIISGPLTEDQRRTLLTDLDPTWALLIFGEGGDLAKSPDDPEAICVELVFDGDGPQPFLAEDQAVCG